MAEDTATVDTPTEGDTTSNTPSPSPADIPPKKVDTAPAAAEPTDNDGTSTPDIRALMDELARTKKEAQNVRASRREEREAREALAKQLEELTAKHTESDDRWNKLAALFNPEADKPPTAEELAAQFADERAQWDLKSADYETKLSAAEEKARAAAIERAAERAARKANVDADALLDSRSFLSAASKLDPTTDTFAADLESAVAAAVDANPKLRLAQAAKRSGAEIPGRSGGSEQLTREQVTEMAQRDPAALDKARREGRLKHLGIG